MVFLFPFILETTVVKEQMWDLCFERIKGLRPRHSPNKGNQIEKSMERAIDTGFCTGVI